MCTPVVYIALTRLQWIHHYAELPIETRASDSPIVMESNTLLSSSSFCCACEQEWKRTRATEISCFLHTCMRHTSAVSQLMPVKLAHDSKDVRIVGALKCSRTTIFERFNLIENCLCCCGGKCIAVPLSMLTCFLRQLSPQK